MYDDAHPDPAVGSHHQLHQRLRASWWILALAGVAALGLAISIHPRPLPAASAPEPAVAKRLPPPPDPLAKDEALAPVSLTDVVGKASLGLLLVYAVGWGLVRLRRGGWSPHLSVLAREEPPRRLRLAETLALGPEQAVLHLVEVDGTVLLLGSLTDQVSVLWAPSPSPPAPASTAGPVVPAEEAPTPRPAARLELSPPERKSLAAPQVRHEADWEQERSRLIRSLVNSDEVA